MTGILIKFITLYSFFRCKTFDPLKIVESSLSLSQITFRDTLVFRYSYIEMDHLAAMIGKEYKEYMLICDLVQLCARSIITTSYDMTENPNNY